jgi:hypothetical protein
MKRFVDDDKRELIQGALEDFLATLRAYNEAICALDQIHEPRSLSPLKQEAGRYVGELLREVEVEIAEWNDNNPASLHVKKCADWVMSHEDCAGYTVERGGRCVACHEREEKRQERAWEDRYAS